MPRHSTLSELFWPENPESLKLAVQWAATAAVQALDLAWRGFEQFRIQHLTSVDLNQPLEQLERDLARNHQIEITILWARETGGYSSLIPVHEYPELESRSSAIARPPTIDLGFAHRENRRWHWPIEAKVIRQPKQISLYMSDVRKFTSGTAAPLVGEGGLIAYLLSGNDDQFFDELQNQLAQSLTTVSDFAARSHRASFHFRAPFPDIRLHHMVMACMES